MNKRQRKKNTKKKIFIFIRGVSFKDAKVNLNNRSYSFTMVLQAVIVKKGPAHESGFYDAPYNIMMESDNRIERDAFMEKYSKDHQVCPKCGSENHSSTFVGYVLIIPEQYKDLNICTCGDCGDKHTCHSRVSKEQFKKNGIYIPYIGPFLTPPIDK